MSTPSADSCAAGVAGGRVVVRDALAAQVVVLGLDHGAVRDGAVRTAPRGLGGGRGRTGGRPGGRGGRGAGARHHQVVDVGTVRQLGRADADRARGQADALRPHRPGRPARDREGQAGDDRRAVHAIDIGRSAVPPLA